MSRHSIKYFKNSHDHVTGPSTGQNPKTCKYSPNTIERFPKKKGEKDVFMKSMKKDKAL